MFSTIFMIIMLTIGAALAVDWIDRQNSTIPIEEVDNGPHFYIRKDLKSGRIY